MVSLLLLFFFLYLVPYVYLRLRAVVKASLLTLIMIDLAADDDFGFVRGRCSNSAVLPDRLTKKSFLLLYFKQFNRAILNPKD